MIISFFEEFPTDKNLKKLNLIDFPTKIYAAAHNLKEFYRLEEKIKKRNENVKEVIYWKILPVKDGYWLSPLSKRKALLDFLYEIKNTKNKPHILVDLEPPLLAKSLFIKEVPNYLKNKKTLEEIVKSTKTTTVGWPFLTYIKEKMGFSFNPNKYGTNKIEMLYKIPLLKMNKAKICKEGIKKFGNRYKAGFGCITKGIFENERILSPPELEEDLNIAEKAGIKEVVIFRLNGLNLEYLKIIKNKIKKSKVL